MTDYAIILAGGKGLRMGTDIPKQFLPIGGLPVLMHTIRRFRAYSTELNIILVLSREQHDYWQDLCQEYCFDEDYIMTIGGETRFHSIKNGLRLIPDDADGVVAVHDGVRPFPSLEVIARCYAVARCSGTAVPVVPVVETLRHLQNGSVSVPRSEYRLVQTPQAFSVSLHKEAYAQPYQEAFTDDASVVEALGHRITLVEGNRENIKITTPFDLLVAETVLRHKDTSFVTKEHKDTSFCDKRTQQQKM